MKNLVIYIHGKGGNADATLTVMEGGEHWFHTEEQMDFLDRWIAGTKQ